MAATTQVSGTVTFPDNQHPEIATINFTLAQVGIANEIILPSTVTASVDPSDGSFTTSLWPNDDDERGTWYIVSVTSNYTTPHQGKVRDTFKIGSIRVEGSTALDLADLFIDLPVPLPNTAEIEAALASSVAAAEAAKDAATSSVAAAENAAALSASSAASAYNSTRGLAETIGSAMPLAQIPNGLAIEKKRSDFIEWAVYSPIHSNGVDWARWFTSVRLISGSAGAPEIGTATLAKFYGTTALFDENRTTGITATTPTSTYATTDGSRTGTWTGAATVGGVTDIDAASSAATVSYDVVVPAGATIYARARTASTSGRATVTVKDGATEISSGEYVAQLIGSDRFIPYDRNISGTGLTLFPIARPTSAATYTVEITWDSGLIQEGGIEVHQIGYNSVGVHGTSIQGTTAGSPLSNWTENAGVKYIYQVDSATEIKYKYFANTQGGTLNFTVYDAFGTEIGSYDNATVNTEASNSIATVTVASGLTLGTYFVHVELDSSTTDTGEEMKWLSTGVIQETVGGILGQDEFDILDMPENPSSTTDVGTYMLCGQPNFIAAIEGRPTGAAQTSSSYYSCGTHANETELDNGDLTVTVDGVVVDYDGASDDDFFYAENKIEIEFSTNVHFDSSVDAGEGEFMTLTRKITYQKGGVVRVETNATDLTDYKVRNDMCMMLQVPNSNSSLATNTGGGYSNFAVERGGNYVTDQSDNVAEQLTNFSETMAFYNDKYAVYAKLLNLSEIITQTGSEMDVTNNGLINDLATDRAKGYMRQSSLGFTQADGFTRTTGGERRVVKVYRIVPFENGDTLLGA